MRKPNGTVRVLVAYLVCMIVGQAMAVGIGLLIDPYSKTAALATFIPLYYAMYWVAWRVALLLVEREPAPTASTGSSGVTAAMLFAPAVLALDFAD